MKNEIHYLHDAAGRLAAVQIPAAIWAELEPAYKKIFASEISPAKPAHRLEEFTDFLDAWNYPYEYKPAVKCPGCNNESQNWQKDENFRLHSANIGGILVFRCLNCGGTIRQKYFKTHMALEFTPPAP